MKTSDTVDKLTVVIPVYNREEELQRCLDSIAAQTIGRVRVIVVDDGSTDSSARVARQHPVVAQVIEGKHRGPAAARNAGLAEVTTEWTMFFDSDDTMHSGHIAAALAAATDEADIVGWDVRAISRDGRTKTLPFEATDAVWHNIMHGTFATLRYMARTELFRRAGGWDESLRVWEDIELGARLLALSPKTVKAAGTGADVYRSEQSVSGNTWMANIEKYPAVLAALERAVGPEHADWIALKTAILAGDIAREDASAGRKMYEEINNKTIPVRFAYHYRKAGGRGVARLLRPFFSKGGKR